MFYLFLGPEPNGRKESSWLPTMWAWEPLGQPREKQGTPTQTKRGVMMFLSPDPASLASRHVSDMELFGVCSFVPCLHSIPKHDGNPEVRKVLGALAVPF